MMDAQTLTRAFGGIWRGQSGNAPCPVCQTERRRDQQGLSLRMEGGRLLAFCHKSGCSFRDIATAAGFSPGAVMNDATAQRAANKILAENSARRENQAKALWHDPATAPIHGTLAETYLRGRGITCALPDSLRFQPNGWHATGHHLPMMLARVDGAAGFAVHRTYLRADGTGKAAVTPAKAMLGPCAGGAVRLSVAEGLLVVSANTRRDDAALAQFSDRLRTILDTPMPMDPDTRELHPRQLPLAPDARALLVAFADTIEGEQRAGGSLAHVTGYASKSAEQAARIAAVLTLWQDLHAPVVALQAMGWGIALAQFYLSEAVRLSDAANLSAETRQAEALRLWLLDSWPKLARGQDRDPSSITPKDVVQFGPNALRETRTVQRLMAILAEYGWLVVLPDGTEISGIARKLAYRIVRGSGVV